MKNKIFAALFGFFATTAFVACSSDDDGGSSAVPSPTITDENGNAYQVASVGGIKFTYDENGKLSSFKESEYGDTYYIEGNTLTIEYDDELLKVTLNNNGFISKATLSGEYKDKDGSYEKGNVTISFSYNSDKQLTGASYSGSSEWYDKEDGEKGSNKMSGTLKNTWSKGNLTKSEQEENWTETENGVKDVDHSRATYTYEYGNVANTSKQFPYMVGRNSTVIFEVGLDIFCIVGMYGVGPAYFPTSYTEDIVEECSQDDGYTYNRTYNLAFTLNSNGTIKTESRDGWSLTYTYNSISRAADFEQVESILPSLKDQMKKMLTRRHKKL